MVRPNAAILGGSGGWAMQYAVLPALRDALAIRWQAGGSSSSSSSSSSSYCSHRLHSNRISVIMFFLRDVCEGALPLELGTQRKQREREERTQRRGFAVPTRG